MVGGWGDRQNPADRLDPIGFAVILQDRPHPEQGYRSCLGILRLARPYGATRLDAAALRALEIGARNYGSVKSILEKKLDGQPLHEPRAPDEIGIEHPNIRGSSYYHCGSAPKRNPSISVVNN